MRRRSDKSVPSIQLQIQTQPWIAKHRLFTIIILAEAATVNQHSQCDFVETEFVQADNQSNPTGI